MNSRFRLLQGRLAAERGSVIMEALVGAVLVAVMATAFFGALNGSNRVSGAAKLRAQAAALASDDQERLRSMPVASLNQYHQAVTKTVAGLSFVVDSKADWIADKTKAATCTGNGAAADYLKITSTVTPANTNSGLQPVAISSTVTPAPGSFNGQGSLAVTVVDRNGAGVPGVSVNVSGPASGASFTDANGCAFLGYLPAGTTYTIAIAKSGYVDQDGDDTPSVSGFTINDQQVATQGFTYDLAGSANVSFASQPVDGAGNALAAVPSSQWKLNVYNSNHVWTAGVNYPTSVPTSSPWPSTGAQSSFAVAKLFPFTSTYGVYPGDNCTKNDPGQNGVTVPGLQVDPGVVGIPYTATLPSLNVYGTVGTVKQAGLRVKITHTTSGCGTWSIVRQTNANGLLDDPGVPFGTYSVCVDNSPNAGAGSRKSSSQTFTATALPGTAQINVVVPTSGTTGVKC